MQIAGVFPAPLLTISGHWVGIKKKQLFFFPVCTFTDDLSGRCESDCRRRIALPVYLAGVLQTQEFRCPSVRIRAWAWFAGRSESVD